jgi:hypothetical protein
MKIIKLTESDLRKIINKVLTEDIKTNINPKNLKFGDRGPEVKKLQQRLIDTGALTLRKGPTGYFGNLTQKALNTAQGTQTSSSASKLKDKRQSNVKQQQSKKGQTLVKTSYTFTPRIDQELQYIKQRNLGGSPFFIYDPKDNLIFLFENADTFVAKSQVVDGADMQKEQDSAEALTMEKWCQISGLESKPYRCTDPKTKKEAKPFYSVLTPLKTRFLPKGIYKISALSRDEGYTGSGSNVWKLQDTKTGKNISAAIHGIPNIPSRLKASEDLEKYLKSDLSSGKIPQEYLNDVKTIANANQSFGCVGVPAKFVDNPQVKSILEGGNKWYKKSIRVFVMGDTGKDFLVQNSVQFFEKLGGDGQFCINPESLASKMSNVA